MPARKGRPRGPSPRPDAWPPDVESEPLLRGPQSGWLRDVLSPRLPVRERIALLIAVDSKGNTGDDAAAKMNDLIAATGLKERQILRHIRALRQEGVLTQTL